MAVSKKSTEKDQCVTGENFQRSKSDKLNEVIKLEYWLLSYFYCIFDIFNHNFTKSTQFFSRKELVVDFLTPRVSGFLV